MGSLSAMEAVLGLCGGRCNADDSMGNVRNEYDHLHVNSRIPGHPHCCYSYRSGIVFKVGFGLPSEMPCAFMICGCCASCLVPRHLFAEVQACVDMSAAELPCP